MKIKLLIPLVIIFSIFSCSKDYDDGVTNPPPTGNDAEINWEKASDSSTTALLLNFWNSPGRYFNEKNNNTNFHYWPQAHALDVIVDAYIRTGNNTYRTYMNNWFEGVKQKNGGSFLNEYYDDMEWNALALLRAYKATGDNKFLSAVEDIWADIQTGWNNTMGGGIAWRKSQLYYKNTPANAPAAILAARLYKENNREEDLDWAKKIYQYVKDSLYNSSTGWVYDGINSNNDGVRNTTWKFTYNQGTFIGAALELFSITNNSAYLNDAIKAADFTLSDNVLNNFSDNLLRDEGGGDGGLFKGVFIRYFTNLIQTEGLVSSNRNRYIDYITHNAETLWTKGTDKNYLLFGSYWKNPPGPQTDLTIQLSGATLIEAMAILEKENLLKNN